MTILANTYQTAGTSQAVTVPYQSKPFLGFIFIQFAAGTASLSPSWGAPPASSGAGGGAEIHVKAFGDPPDPMDPDLSVTVNVTTGPLLVIAMSVSRDGFGIYNVSHHDVQTGTNWSGALIPATGTVKETPSPISWLASDIETLGFTTAFLDHTVNGTANVTPNSTLAEVAEVSAAGAPWVIEVSRDTAGDGTDKTVTVSGTGSGGTQRVSGAVFTFHIGSTFVRGGGWGRRRFGGSGF